MPKKHPHEASSSQRPAWVSLVGMLLGAVVFLALLPWQILLQPLRPGVPSSYRFMAIAVYTSPTIVAAVFGVLAARWSWSWAQRPVHPLLTRCESWAPLRGRWLLIAAAVGLAVLLWMGQWIALSAVLMLPELAPLLGKSILDANTPLAIAAIAAAGAAALGYLGSQRARSRSLSNNAGVEIEPNDPVAHYSE